MKARVVVGMCLLLALSAGVQAAITYSFPATFVANPSGQWSLAYGAPEWSTANDLSAMAPRSGALNWGRPGYSTPRVEGELWALSGNADWPGNNAGVLVFQAPLTGKYSINTLWYAYGAGGDPTTERLSVRMAPNVSSPATTLWSTSYSWSEGSEWVESWDLGTASELQNIDLTAGSYVFFSMNVDTKSYYPTAYNRFKNADGSLGGAITYVPEPATILMMLGGLLAVVRNRKVNSL